MNNFMKVAVISSALLGSMACDYSGDFIYGGAVDGVPGIDHLGVVLPVEVNSPEDVANAAFFGEIGPTKEQGRGGITMTFEGTGNGVCIFVDPEAVFWNQSVSKRSPNARYTYPDNVFDDGDLDLTAGYAVYYNGTPGTEDEGGEIGDFRVRYQDGLDQEITIALSECVIIGKNDEPGHAGRGGPEFCDIEATVPGVTYVILMETWSTPIDDNRLGYGAILVDGTCADLIVASGAADPECVLMGESINPEDGLSYERGFEFENHWCNPTNDMAEYCEGEAAQVISGAINCAEDHCFCGDPRDSPSGGSD